MANGHLQEKQLEKLKGGGGQKGEIFIIIEGNEGIGHWNWQWPLTGRPNTSPSIQKCCHRTSGEGRGTPHNNHHIHIGGGQLGVEEAKVPHRPALRDSLLCEKRQRC